MGLVRQHEDRHVGGARGLLHIVRHEDYRVFRLQRVQKLLDLQGGRRVQGRAGLVQEEDLGLDRYRAGYAEPLLLPSRKGRPRGAQLVLDFVPESRRAQRPLDRLVVIGFGFFGRLSRIPL